MDWRRLGARITYNEAGQEKAGWFARVFRRYRWFWTLRRWRQRTFEGRNI